MRAGLLIKMRGERQITITGEAKDYLFINRRHLESLRG